MLSSVKLSVLYILQPVIFPGNPEVQIIDLLRYRQASIKELGSAAGRDPEKTQISRCTLNDSLALYLYYLQMRIESAHCVTGLVDVEKKPAEVLLAQIIAGLSQP